MSKKTKILLAILALTTSFVACTSIMESVDIDTEIVKNETTETLPIFKVENKEFNELTKKADFDIRLEKRISEQEIEKIARSLKSEHPGYDRYFIAYYLPDMIIDSGAWATSHFNPDLNVEILGLSDEQEEVITDDINLPEGEILGVWMDNTPFMQNITIISQQDGKYLLRQIFGDESYGDRELDKQGNKFIYENDFGEYYQLENDGTLTLYDEIGEISNMKLL